MVIINSPITRRPRASDFSRSKDLRPASLHPARWFGFHPQSAERAQRDGHGDDHPFVLCPPDSSWGSGQRKAIVGQADPFQAFRPPRFGCGLARHGFVMDANGFGDLMSDGLHGV